MAWREDYHVIGELAQMPPMEMEQPEILPSSWVQANGPSKIEDLTKPTPGNKKCSKKMLFLTVFGVLLGFMILLESYSVYSMMQAQEGKLKELQDMMDERMKNVHSKMDKLEISVDERMKNMDERMKNGHSKMLLIGGSGQGINAQTVHLLDLRTGVTCGFKNLPGDVSVNEGEAVFINGKVIACASNGCVTWEENQWTSNEPKHTVSLKEDAAILLPDNRWLLVEHTGSIPPKSAIYDPVNNTFGEGFEFNAKMGGAGYCMTLISNDTIGFISLADKGLYSYKVPKGPIDQVGEMPDVDIGTQGSCRTLIKDGIHMVVFFSKQVFLWNTMTNKVTTDRHAYPMSVDRDDHQSWTLTSETIVFGGGENSDNTMYLYTLDDGFVPCGTLGADTSITGDSARQDFVMVSVPAERFHCL